jgi:SAM-dependent methyltransferase
LLGRFVRKNAQRFPPSVRFADVTRGLPVADASSIGVYASHVLEHLAARDVHRALDETYRILATGGVFRVVVPDLEAQATDYLEAVRRGQPDAAGQFLRRIGMEQMAGGLPGLLIARIGTSAHLSMWDYPSLAGALSQHGFVSIRRAAYGDAPDPAFRAVEDACRFEGACAIEAIRPGSH